MALFSFGKKRKKKRKHLLACGCGCPTGEAEEIATECCPDLKEGEICCIKVLGAGCKSCHEQYENAKQAVKDNGAFRRGRIHYRYAESNGIRGYGMPALVVNEKVVAMGKVLKAADVVALLHKLGF